MKQSVKSPEIDESAVVGDVLDHTVEHLAFGETGDQFGTLVGTLILENRTPGHHDVAATAVHLENAELVLLAHERCHVANRTDVDLAAGEKGEGAAEIDGEAALDPLVDVSLDAVTGCKGRLELVPDFLALGLFPGKDRFALVVLQPLDKDLDPVADGHGRFASGRVELAKRHPSLGLESDIDQHQVTLDVEDGSARYRSFDNVDAFKELVEEIRKVFFPWGRGGGRRILRRARVVRHGACFLG